MRLLSAVLLVVSVAGNAAAQRRPPSRAGARALIRKFLAAEATGAYLRANALVAGCEDGGADDLAVTRSVHVLPSVVRQDTVVITVVYDVAGSFWSGDPHRSAHYARFRASPLSDSVSYAVYADARGHLWIDCAHFGMNHVAASHLARYVIALDDSSLAAWRSAGLPRR